MATSSSSASITNQDICENPSDIRTEVAVLEVTSRKTYALNAEKARDKIIEGVSREAIKREDKQTCTIFSFNTGAFYDIVLKSLKCLNDNVSELAIDDETLSCTIEDRSDQKTNLV